MRLDLNFKHAQPRRSYTNWVLSHALVELTPEGQFKVVIYDRTKAS
jgi:hypothetical protein